MAGAEEVPQTLEEKVSALEAELCACKSRLEREKQLRLKSQASAARLRARVEELTKKVANYERIAKVTSSKEIQTEGTSEWADTGYYYYPEYYNSDPHDLPKASVLPSNNTEGSNSNSVDHLQLDNYPDVNGTKQKDHEQQNNALHNIEKAEDPLLVESTLAESLRAAAEAAVSQTGFSYDERTGLYYDHSTGFYYDSENQLYYDPTTGIYYYCDVESGRYQFHSRVDLQSYGTETTQQNKDRKGKKKRKDAECSTANEHKVHQLTENMANLKISSSGLATSGKGRVETPNGLDLNTAEQKSCGNLNSLSSTRELSTSEEEECSNVKKAKVDVDTRENLAAKESSATSNSNLLFEKNVLCSVTDDCKTEMESEPEEGEITDSEEEEYSTEDEISETENSENTDSEGELF